jgi:hypothetical protein
MHTNAIKFNLSHSQEDSFQIPYKDKAIKQVTNIKFLGLEIDQHLNCKTHTEQIIPKLSSACCAVRSMFHFSNLDTLKMIYFAYFHSVMKYGIIFWGKSTDSTSLSVAEKTVRIVTGAKSIASCKIFLKCWKDCLCLRNIYYS